MTRVILIGKNQDDIKPILKAKGLTLVVSSPDLIIAYGGDGALLEAEREFPDIPKLPIRDYKTAPLCPIHNAEKIIEDYVNGKLEKSELLRISGKCLNNNKNRTIEGINDIFIHNVERNSAIRYRIHINNELYLTEVASDCIGFATPHGSTGYFQSITNCVFRQGIGIALSNTREHANHVIVPEDSKIAIEILRGPAVMVADNNPRQIELDHGDKLVISRTPTNSIVYGIAAFMCFECRKLRHLKM